jgi:hypothetical protein
VKKTILAVFVFIMPAAAAAQDTTYKYDALGRLINTTTKGVITTIDYDQAGNRTSYNVKGAPNAEDSGSHASVSTIQRFVIVPLNGFTIIPIN